jgi:hypothetical protein
VLVDEVRPEEELRSPRIDPGSPSARDAPILAENDDPVGDDRDDVELVGGGDEGLATLAELADEVDEDPRFVRGSSDAVGSSRRETSGRSDRTEAIAARFFSPPDSSNGARSAKWAMSIARSASSQVARTSSGGRPSWTGRRRRRRARSR